MHAIAVVQPQLLSIIFYCSAILLKCMLDTAAAAAGRVVSGCGGLLSHKYHVSLQCRVADCHQHDACQTTALSHALGIPALPCFEPCAVQQHTCSASMLCAGEYHMTLDTLCLSAALSCLWHTPIPHTIICCAMVCGVCCAATRLQCWHAQR
jgi:hypothetical protein